VYEIGAVYYSVYFVDMELRYPFVGCYVFLGENLLGTEPEATWYFQDCESFAKFGSFENDVEGNRQVLGLTKGSVANMVAMDVMIAELCGAESRRAANARPRRL